jgi:long-chain fatty acid transport protein
VKASPVFAPSANLGVTVVPNRWLRLGASGQLPFVINAPATVTVRLPNAPEFDNAQQVGDKAHVKMKLPGILRLGVEVSPFQTLRLEVSYVLEFWSAHHSIDIVPDNITLTGVTGFPSPYVVPPISIPRNFRNSNSVRIGGEYSGLQLFSWTMHLRAGFNWDQSAIPDAYLSPLTVDLNKYTASLGGGIEIAPHWRLDAVYAHIFGGDVSVPPSQAAVPRINPVKGNPVSVEAINGGHYSARADIFGGGFNFRF